jgi:hypothetical protein
VGFGAAAVGPSGRVRKADLVLPGHLGMGRHLFLDTAIADPTHAWKRVFKMYSPDYLITRPQHFSGFALPYGRLRRSRGTGRVICASACNQGAYKKQAHRYSLYTKLDYQTRRALCGYIWLELRRLPQILLVLVRRTIN